MDNCLLVNEYGPKIKYSSRSPVTKQNIDEIIKSLETICIFPPLKKMRDSFAKKHKYEIISKIITKPVSKTTAKPTTAEKTGKKR